MVEVEAVGASVEVEAVVDFLVFFLERRGLTLATAVFAFLTPLKKVSIGA